MLLGIFVAWVFVAAALYVGLFGWWEPESIGAFLSRVFTTPEGWALIVIGNAIGLAFSALVLGLSVVSLPMLVDCDISAVAGGVDVMARRQGEPRRACSAGASS